MGEFRDLLEGAAKQFPTKRAFARAIGITPGRLSRVLGGEHSFDVGNCLTLAKLTGESPSRVLRVAGKAEIADAIEALYGPGVTSVTPKERELLDLWNRLTERAREGLRLTMSELASSTVDVVHHDGDTVKVMQVKRTDRPQERQPSEPRKKRADHLKWLRFVVVSRPDNPD